MYQTVTILTFISLGRKQKNHPAYCKVAPSATSAPAENKPIIEEARDPLFKATSVQVFQPNSEFFLHHYGLFIRKSTVDNATQIVVAAPLRKPDLHWHTNVPSPYFHVNKECTICFDVSFSGHIWQTTYMKRTPSALTARKTEADLSIKISLTLPRSRTTRFRYHAYPQYTTENSRRKPVCCHYHRQLL